jgi:hypothetical protein
MRTEDIFLVISRGAYAAQNPCLAPDLTPVTAVSTVTAVTGRADTLKGLVFGR